MTRSWSREGRVVGLGDVVVVHTDLHVAAEGGEQPGQQHDPGARQRRDVDATDDAASEGGEAGLDARDDGHHLDRAGGEQPPRRREPDAATDRLGEREPERALERTEPLRDGGRRHRQGASDGGQAASLVELPQQHQVAQLHAATLHRRLSNVRSCCKVDG